MAIDVVVVSVRCLYLSFYILSGWGYKEANQVGYNVITIMTLSLLAYYIYIFIDIILCLGEHITVFWNLLNGGPSHSEPLLGSSESLWDGTRGTNPRQQPWVLDKWVDAGWSGFSLFMMNLSSTQFPKLSTLSWNCWVLFHRIGWIGAPYRCTY
jgi:hypothetical protein